MGHTPTNELPVLMPLAAQLSEEEKKARQRLHVKRTYYRKTKVLEELRDRVVELEYAYAQLLNKHKSSQPNALGITAQTAQMVELYSQLLEQKEQLRAQNEEVRSAIAENDSFHAKILTWMDSDAVTVVHADAEMMRIPTLRTLKSAEECHRIAQCSYEEMRQTRVMSPEPSRLSEFGWRDQRKMDTDCVNFLMQKQFSNTSASALSLRSWGVLASPTNYPRLFSLSTQTTLHPLQRINEDNVLMYRVVRGNDNLSLIKAFFLLSRFQTPEGFAIVLRSMDPSCLTSPPSTPPGYQEHWSEISAWTTYQNGVGDDGSPICNFEFGGVVKSSPIMGTSAWMLELLLVVLRWESMVSGPIFALPG